MRLKNMMAAIFTAYMILVPLLSFAQDTKPANQYDVVTPELTDRVLGVVNPEDPDTWDIKAYTVLGILENITDSLIPSSIARTTAVDANSINIVDLADDVSALSSSINYLSGVTGPIQDQLDGKEPALSGGGMSKDEYDSDDDGLVDSDAIDFSFPISPPDESVSGGMQMANGVAGEALPAYRLVYKSADVRYYLYDADGANTGTYPVPVAMTISSAASAEDTVTLVTGVFMLKTEDFATDMGSWGGCVPVYAATTAGELTKTGPSASGDKKLIVGHRWGTDRFLMSLPVMVDIEVP